MSIFYELVAQQISEEVVQKLEDMRKEVLLDRCYHALMEIRAVLDDERLDDAACFEKIERIVEIYEALGSRTSRHDFG